MFDLNPPAWLQSSIFDASAAVTLFFVLSGFVLALSIDREPVCFRSYVNFGIRRVLRIYPMHIAATLLAFAILLWIKSRGGFHQNLEMPVHFLNSEGLQLGSWLLQLTLVFPGMDSNFANPPVWTLMTEAKVAIVFPFIAWTILNLRRPAGTALVIILIMFSDWADRNLVGTFALLGQFAIGAWVANLPKSFFERFETKSWVIWTLVSVALYSAVSFRNSFPSAWIGYYLGAVGSAGIIISAIGWKFMNHTLTALQKFLRRDISYGIYILHFPILLGLRKLQIDMTHIPSASFIFATALSLTIALSMILGFVVELPAIRLGRRLTKMPPKSK